MAEVELPNPEDLKEVKEKEFTRKVALITAFFAVMLAVTSLGGSNSMKDMLLAQQQSSDQWAFYQAKVIREHLYRIEKLRMQNDLDIIRAAQGEEAYERARAMIATLAEEERRYNAEKKDIEKEAKRLEEERDLNRSRDPYFDYAEVLLQIAIVMASVSILSSSRGVFFFALGAAVLGGVLSVNGFLLLFKLPFLH